MAMMKMTMMTVSMFHLVFPHTHPSLSLTPFCLDLLSSTVHSPIYTLFSSYTLSMHERFSGDVIPLCFMSHVTFRSFDRSILLLNVAYLKEERLADRSVGRRGRTDLKLKSFK